MADEPKLCILSVGRSGSGYIAAVLNAAGVRCGHESWWNPIGERESGLDADSSWCALPDVLDGYDGEIVMQVRHPLLTIASLTQSQDHGPYIACRERLMGEGALTGDPLRAATATWLDWNGLSECVAAEVWRVEDVDADRIGQLAGLAGRWITRTDAERALASVPTNTNDHETALRLTWDDLPADLVGDVQAMAKEYGYR